MERPAELQPAVKPRKMTMDEGMMAALGLPKESNSEPTRGVRFRLKVRDQGHWIDYEPSFSDSLAQPDDPKKRVRAIFNEEVRLDENSSTSEEV